MSRSRVYEKWRKKNRHSCCKARTCTYITRRSYPSGGMSDWQRSAIATRDQSVARRGAIADLSEVETGSRDGDT